MIDCLFEQGCHVRVFDRIQHLVAVAVEAHQAGIAQAPRVMRGGRGRDTHMRCQVVDVPFAGCQRIDDSGSGEIGQGLEKTDYILHDRIRQRLNSAMPGSVGRLGVRVGMAVGVRLLLGHVCKCTNNGGYTHSGQSKYLSECEDTHM